MPMTHVEAPKRASLLAAQRTAEELRVRFGAKRSLRHCALKIALARRARSRRSFVYWTEVSRLVETRPLGVEEVDAATTAELIAGLAGSFAILADNAELHRLAYLLNLVSRNAREAGVGLPLGRFWFFEDGTKRSGSRRRRPAASPPDRDSQPSRIRSSDDQRRITP